MVFVILINKIEIWVVYNHCSKDMICYYMNRVVSILKLTALKSDTQVGWQCVYLQQKGRRIETRRRVNHIPPEGLDFFPPCSILYLLLCWLAQRLPDREVRAEGRPLLLSLQLTSFIERHTKNSPCLDYSNVVYIRIEVFGEFPSSHFYVLHYWLFER